MNTTTPSPQAPKLPASKFSTAAKVAQAAAFAALLVPLSSVPVEASSFTATVSCGFGGAGYSGGTPVSGYDPSSGERQCNPASPAVPGGEGFDSSTAQYDFGNYFLTLAFADVRGEFYIGVQSEEISQTELANSGRLHNFPADICVPVVDGVSTCAVFHFSGDTSPSDTTWRGEWTATINWIPDTNAGYPGDTVRVRHARGDTPPDDFDTDITVPDSYFSGIDPEIAGADDNFQAIVVTAETVPEPASLLLLGAGLTALGYRRRRVLKERAAARKE